MLYEMIKIAIDAKETDGLVEKINKLYQSGKLTEDEKSKLVELMQ